MKNLKLITLGMLLIVSSSIQSQVSINVSLGRAPSWGPVGYASVDYYYLPDVEAYYDIRSTQFIFFSRGKWIRSRYLPNQYRNYDLYNGYKVVLNDYHGSRPYAYFRNHKEQYYKGYKGRPQRSIGNRNDDHKKYENRKNNGNNHREEKGNRGNRGDNGREHGKR
jgi:hypothetical protein